MPIRLSQFEMPDAIVKDENLSATEKAMGANFGRYTAEPFEIGYARTIGNSLRRVLLSSIEGLAISAVRIQGAPHEFMAIPGVVEDVTDIILALKKVILRSPSGAKQIQPVRVKRTGPGFVTAGALAVDFKMAGALALSLGIAIQNIPEGAIISMPLRAEGNSRPRAFAIGALSGIVEPLGGALMLFLATSIIGIMPYMLSFAAGAMLYVVVEELVPEYSQGKHSNIGTVGFAIGFALMMVLDVVLG